MKSRSKISVLMPVYNTKSSELRTAIESVLNQTFSDFEFLIINDCSTNDAEDVILSYKDERIKYYKNETNLKLISTLNKGFDLCRGEYIARLDSDDYSAPDRLEKQLKYMEEHSDVGLLGTLFEFVPQADAFEVNVDDIPKCIRYLPGCLLHSSAMIRRSVLTENKIYYNKNCVHAEDFKMWSDLSRVSKVAVLPEILTFYRQSPDGICASNQQWQNKMLRIIALDNMIMDFDCNEKLMSSILIKYVKNSPVTQDEFTALKKFLEKVANTLILQVSNPYKIRIANYTESILNHFTVKKEDNIIWMNP